MAETKEEELAELIVKSVKEEMRHYPADENFIKTIKVEKKEDGSVQVIFQAPRYNKKKYKETGLYVYYSGAGSYASELDLHGEKTERTKIYRNPEYLKYVKRKKDWEEKKKKAAKEGKKIVGKKPKVLGRPPKQTISQTFMGHKGYASDPEGAVMKAVKIFSKMNNGKATVKRQKKN